MSGTLILASDIGTSSVKSAIFNLKGELLATAGVDHATSQPRPGWAEQDAAGWWDGFCHTVRQLGQASPGILDQIGVIGISGQMLGCLPVDKENRPLHPALIHADTRALEQTDKIRSLIGQEEMFFLTGNILDARSGLAKLLWFKENVPDCYRKAAAFLQAKDFIVACLTGQEPTTDYSDAAHAQWSNLAQKSYLGDVLLELGLDQAKLPRLHKGTDVAGSLQARAARTLGLPAGIPVVVGAGDGSCAGTGAGAGQAGDVYACLGTTAWVSYFSDKPIYDKQQRLFNVPAPDGRTSAVFGTVQSAGHSVRWAMRLFSDPDERTFDQSAALARPGSNGLFFLPYLDGERSPVFDEKARGLFFGAGSGHESSHFRRAVLEGVALALGQIVDVLREERPIQQIRLIGGGARSALWRQIIAASTASELLLLSTPATEATALGMALAAAVGAGYYPDIATAQKIIRVSSREKNDPELTAKMQQAGSLYRKLYPTNRQLFNQLAALQED